MRIQEGPAFSGLFIGMGLVFLINNQTGNLPLALFSGVVVGLADYFILAWVNDRKAKRK